MSCQEDAALVGPVSLFCGVETWNWSTQQFLDEGNKAKQHGINALFIKVAEVGSPAGGSAGWWYGGLDAFDKNVYQPLKAMGVTVIPYVFPYGYDVQTEIGIMTALLNRYGEVCIDMEGTRWEGQTGTDNATAIAHALTPLPGKVWLSMPADYANNNQNGAFQAMSPATNVWMPMAYSDTLTADALPQVQAINPAACIMPTLDLSQEFGANNVMANAQALKSAGVLAVSLWYEGFANTDPTLVDQIVSLFKGAPTQPVSIPLTSKGEIAAFVDVSQMEVNESEFECGFFAAGEIHCAAPVGQQPKCTPEQLDQWADAANVTGNVGISTGGVSIEDMHNLFKLPGPDGQPRHFWDIDSIAPGSAQSHDIAEIKAALQHGYPVVVTVVETSIFDMDLGGNPYAPNWTPSGNHVLVATGIASDGNLLYHDTANIVGGIFGKVAAQPRRYRNTTTAHTWASIVQLPWLPTIPSGDPLSWASVQAGGQVSLPVGFKSDDGKILTANNGLTVEGNFRLEVLKEGTSWDQGMPILPMAHPSAGMGTYDPSTWVQLFEKGALVEAPGMGGPQKAPVGTWFVNALKNAGGTTTVPSDQAILDAAKSFLKSIGVIQ